ncbi:MAG: hypothetical protein WB341_01850 [Terracidiphilus sp.]
MKLRMKGNSLRLRVSRSELDRLMAGAGLEETIRFGPDPEAFLTYALESDADVSTATVRYGQQRIAVVLGKHRLQTWNEPSQVGIYTSVPIGSEGLLELIVEKDFACLHSSAEENHDIFPNPHADVTR